MKRLSELTAKHGDDLVKPLEWRDIAYKQEARVKQLEEALRKAVAQLESHGFDGHACGADKLLNGGPNERD